MSARDDYPALARLAIHRPDSARRREAAVALNEIDRLSALLKDIAEQLEVADGSGRCVGGSDEGGRVAPVLRDDTWRDLLDRVYWTSPDGSRWGSGDVPSAKPTWRPCGGSPCGRGRCVVMPWWFFVAHVSSWVGAFLSGYVQATVSNRRRARRHR